MTVESSEDRDTLLADFGMDAVYKNGATEVRALRGIFDRGGVGLGVGEVPAAGRAATFLTLESNWPDDFAPATGATLDVPVDPQTTTVYTVTELEPDGTGFVLLVLEDRT